MNTSSLLTSAAVIGCGRMVPGKVGWAQGHVHADAFIQAFPGITLYGVDPNEENLLAFGEAFKVPRSRLFRSTAELYKNGVPDCVGIATWPKLHLPQVLEAVAAGVKRIVCEKPLALDNSEIDQMITACQQANVRLAVAHQRRYNPQFERMRDLVREGALGDRPVLTGRIAEEWDMLSWTTHWFDMANFIFDGPPTSVLAGIDHSGARRYGHAIENRSVVFAEYPGDRQAIFISGPESPIGFAISLEGSAGSLRMTENGVRLVTLKGEVREYESPVEEWRHPDCVRLVKDLAEAYASGGDFRCDARHTVWGTRMAFAAHESAMMQRSVTLPSAVKYAPLEVAQHPSLPKSGEVQRILLLADVHHWEEDLCRSGRDGLIEALGALGHAVTLVPIEQREVMASDFEGQDLLAIYHTTQTLSETTRALVGDWIQEGRPTLVSHCGIGAWAEWDEYRRWIGRYWVWNDGEGKRASQHPMVPCEIAIDPESKHWNAPWVKGWLPIDEVYTGLADSGPLEDIGWVFVEGERHPWAWRSKTAPKLAVFLPGHRADIWQLPVMRTALASMIEGVV